jgi:large subunit ribosomal protein L21
MYAIIKTGSKQYKVAEGDVIHVEKLGKTGESVQFDDVLFVFDKEYTVGTPRVEGAVVKGEILGESFGPKVQSVKYKPRKRKKHKFGHRQEYAKVKITSIATA